MQYVLKNGEDNFNIQTVTWLDVFKLNLWSKYWAANPQT